MKSALIVVAIAAVTLWLPAGGSSAGYTNASLSGPCVWQGLYYPTTSGRQESAGPVSLNMPLVFDGKGNIAIDYAANVNGTFTASPNTTGTYQVDPNGHGTLTYASPATQRVITFDFFITPKGDAIRTMLRSFAGSAIGPRVGNGVCRFDQ